MSRRRPFMPFHFGVAPDARLLGVEEELQRMINDGVPDNDNPIDLMRQFLAGGPINPLNRNDNPLRRRGQNDLERNMLALHRFGGPEIAFEEVAGNARVPAIRPRRNRVPNLPEASGSETEGSSDDESPPVDNEVRLPHANEMIGAVVGGGLPAPVRAVLAPPAKIKNKKKPTNKQLNDANNTLTNAEDDIEKMDTSPDPDGESPDVMEFMSTRYGWFTPRGEKYRRFK